MRYVLINFTHEYFYLVTFAPPSQPKSLPDSFERCGIWFYRQMRPRLIAVKTIAGYCVSEYHRHLCLHLPFAVDIVIVMATMCYLP